VIDERKMEGREKAREKGQTVPYSGK